MKKAKRITALLISCAMLLALLAGCSGTKSRGEDNNDNNTQAEEGYPFTLDNYGRQVEITKRPQKVLTLGPNCTELFAALGLSDLVVGRCPSMPTQSTPSRSLTTLPQRARL